MNVNLVSDESNGHQYTSYFGEDIVIEPNSKCYLNFASLFREGSESLREDGTITIESSEFLPRKVIGTDSSVVDNNISITKTIPAGTYTATQLEGEIQTALTSALNDDEGQPLHYYKAVEEVNEEDEKIGFGIALDEAKINTDHEFVIDSTNSFNSETGGGGDVADYMKTANVVATDTLAFDNYANSDRDFWHYTYDTTKKQFESAIGFTFAGENDGALGFGLYGNTYAKLTNPSTAPNPMTDGAVRPALLTVDQPADEVAPALGFSDSFKLDELGGADIIETAPAGSFYEGFKVDVTGAGVTTDATCYLELDQFAAPSGVLDFDTITGSITGLAATTEFTLTQSATSGLGSGFAFKATSTAGGVIGSTEIQAGVIDAPGGTSNPYFLGDTITLSETSTPGTGTITITVTKLSRYGIVTGFKWVEDSSNYPLSPYDSNSNALSMGEGYVGGNTYTISQDATQEEQPTMLFYQPPQRVLASVFLPHSSLLDFRDRNLSL